MLGHWVHDPAGVEGDPGSEPGLGLLSVETTLLPDKTVRNVVATYGETAVPGYEIHNGDTVGPDTGAEFLTVDGGSVGAVSESGLIFGSYVHGLFLDDIFRGAFLARLGLHVGSDVNYQRGVETALDDLARALETHLDIDALLRAANAD